MTSPLEIFGYTSDLVIWEAVLLSLVSFSVGILGGFVGLALGSMRLPVLLLVGLSPLVAAGTNILVSSFSALTGAVRHFREGRVDIRVVLVMGIPTSIGAFIGGLGSDRVPGSALMLMVAFFVSWQGVELIRRIRFSSGSSQRRASSKNWLFNFRFAGSIRVLSESGIGLVIGLLGGAVGLILGTVRLPVLIRVLRMDPRVSVGTNLSIGFIMGSMGWVGHLVRGHVDYPLLALMASGAVVGSYFGARLTGLVSLDVLVETTGWIMVVIGGILVWQVFW